MDGLRGGSGGERSGPENGGEIRGDGGGGLARIDPLGAEVAESGRRGGECEVVGGFPGGGNVQRFHGSGRSVGEERGVVARVAIGGDREPAVAGFAAGGQGDALLETQRLAGHG